ncbi:serine hydrolase [Virgibacillus phasianinus]|uniref:Serine hydrolase n=1 Tax=Virgibacillus phasianinus TaxID=2017483 RepID=A0A220U2R7_9BACI|nr:serine hydrolase domain-containing protein [Virgibacillus phasianinus]ASK62325.1 serine hydrolase [Virgibacillus phasianinus]
MIKQFITIALIFVFVVSSFFVSARTSYASSIVLEPGPASSVHMLQQPLDEIDGVIQQGIDNRIMAGAVVLVARSGKIVKEDAHGYAARYVNDDYEEMENPVKMQADTIFDLASITKIFTSTAVMQLYEKGKFNLDDPVATYIPAFAQNGKEDVTIRQLLTHTSGFTPWISLYTMADSREEAYQTVFAQPLEHDPGTHYAYSDLNMITLGALVEQLSGERLDHYINEHITEPLGMNDTMFNPPASLKDRTAATEYQPWTDRGLVWAEVHDENAWIMDGVAGHAGLFSTARDLAIFAQMILNDGQYEGARILQPESVQLMGTNQLPNFPGDAHGLGWELNQSWYMGALASPSTMGHTGFTGTSIVINPNKQTMVIVLTNNVHPTRESSSTNPIRRQVAGKTADAIYAWSAASMKELVKQLEEKGEFENSDAVHRLTLHLTAVNQYESNDQAEKVVKHMKNFKLLLDHQKESELISEEAYETLKTDANYLIEKWQ